MRIRDFTHSKRAETIIQPVSTFMSHLSTSLSCSLSLSCIFSCLGEEEDEEEGRRRRGESCLFAFLRSMPWPLTFWCCTTGNALNTCDMAARIDCRDWQPLHSYSLLLSERRTYRADRRTTKDTCSFWTTELHGESTGSPSYMAPSEPSQVFAQQIAQWSFSLLVFGFFFHFCEVLLKFGVVFAQGGGRGRILHDSHHQGKPDFLLLYFPARNAVRSFPPFRDDSSKLKRPERPAHTKWNLKSTSASNPTTFVRRGKL